MPINPHDKRIDAEYQHMTLQLVSHKLFPSHLKENQYK